MAKITIDFENEMGSSAHAEVEGQELYSIYKLLEELLYRMTKKEAK